MYSIELYFQVNSFNSTNKNVYALEERNSLFAKDPDVRKFDAERVLCNICDRWLSISGDDHLQAVQKWLQHRSECQKVVSGLVSPDGTPESSKQISQYVFDFFNVPRISKY